jgi:serine/threonine protein kinase
MPARFEILRPLDEDSASTLFLIRDEKRGQEACLRRFKTKNAQEIEGLTELFNQLAGIDSIHLEKPVDFGTDKEGFYVVTAAPAAGESLETVLERGPLTAGEFEVVALQLLDALDALHEQAVVHGSIRADFVRITGKSAADWRVTLLGFGQGFATKDDSKEAQVRAYRCTAPEQWVDGTTRRRTDVYALGCVLYEALAARPPFDGRALKEIRHKHIGHDLAPLQKLAGHVPSWMCAWVMHLMAADAEQRPRKAAAARELFERREAPPLPELPPRAESPTEAVSSTPPITLSAPPVSAPVVLPAVQPGARNATSSTIPITPGPHVASAAAARRRTPPPVQRKTYTPPRKPPSASKPDNKKYMIIAASAVALMLAVFILPRCGKQPEPVKGKPVQKQK